MTVYEQAEQMNQYLAAAKFIEMYSRLVTLPNESKEAEDLRDEMDVYWYASSVYGSDETKEKVREMSVWLCERLDPTRVMEKFPNTPE